MTVGEVKSTFSDNNDMKIKFLPCWTCKFGKNISRNKLKYDLMKINCVFGFKVVSRPKTRTKLQKPVHQIWVSVKKLSIKKQSASASDWPNFHISSFCGLRVEKRFEQNPLRAKKEMRKKWLVSPLETTADNWIPLCPCKQIEGKLCVRAWSFVDVVQMTQIGNSSKNLARYSLWMTGVHGKQILDSTLLGLIRSLCQGNFC